MNTWSTPRLRMAFIALVCMLCAAALAYVLTPRIRFADLHPIGSLETTIPSTFAAWRQERSASPVVSPQIEAELSKLYTQTIARTYVAADGYRIMLSLAYGEDQRRDTQVHRPEVCYPAQGFKIGHLQKDTLSVKERRLPVMRMESHSGARFEPVTYWVRVGDHVVRGNLEQGIARLRYGVKGFIADGLLFRVSSIDSNSAIAWQRQDQFVRELLEAMPAADVRSVAGTEDSP